MNFAMLGSDSRAWPLVRAIVACPDHRLTHTALAGSMLQELNYCSPTVRVVEGWEGLAVEPSIDAVVVGGDDEIVCSGAKELAALGKSVILFPSTSQGYVLAFELSIIRDDSGATLFPVFPMRVHPLVKRFRELLSSEELGPVHHLQMERHLAGESRLRSETGINQTEFNEALFGDVDLLRALVGDFDQVTALCSKRKGGLVSLATVTLAGQLHPEATWTLTPSDGESTWRVTARGDLGTAVLFGAAETDTVTLERMPEGISPETVPAGFDEGAAILKVLEAALAGEAVRPDWTDLTRDIDIMAACQRSVDSRRTIDLHFERTSERTLFKSQMTAIGCALLIVTFLASLGFLILGSLFDVNETVMRVLRFIIFLPLGIFLLLQLLLVLARPASSDPSPPKT